MQLLHDGGPAHRATATTAYLDVNNVNAVDFLSKSPDLNIFENIWDEKKPQCEENMGYSDHTESTESKRPPLELRSALCDVNEAPLSCHSDAGGHTGF